jgi:DNA-binding beta-propeller fold protein YncE
MNMRANAGLAMARIFEMVHGIAIDHKDNYVYIADWYSNKVHVFDAKQQQLVDANVSA